VNLCEFCGWEGDEDMRICPKCHEYKGIIRAAAPWDNNPDLDRKIAEMEADPEYQQREP
jgi:hypothetical protein